MGTSFADWALANQGHQILEIVGRVIDLGGFLDLTTTSCKAFNEAAEPDEATNSVIYQTYASSEGQKQIFALLQPSWRIIQDVEGDNDGLVPRSSQMWQGKLADSNGAYKLVHQHDFPISADHLNEVGWWDTNQLPLMDLWHTNFFQVAQKYENSVRNVYLDIARGLQHLP